MSTDEDYYKLLGCSETSTSNHRSYLVVGKLRQHLTQFAHKCTLEHFFFTCWNNGLDKSQTEQITAEFRVWARRHHPDKFANAEEKAIAEETFKKLEQARDVLVDKQKRALYDKWRSGGFASLGITFKQWMKQPAFHSSIHWEQPKQQVLPLSGQEMPQTRADSGVSSLEEFRKGSTVKPTSLLSKFRNNEDLT